MEPTFTAAIIILFFSLIIVLLEVVQIRGINKKLIIENSELKKKLSESQKKEYDNMQEIKLLTWKLDNPPKYKKGDAFGDLTIKFCSVRKPSLSEILANSLIGFISICAGHKQENNKSINFDMYWEYHLSHKYHGDTIKMTESQLDNIKSVEK